jgi:hypothetical protein
VSKTRRECRCDRERQAQRVYDYRCKVHLQLRQQHSFDHATDVTLERGFEIGRHEVELRAWVDVVIT